MVYLADYIDLFTPSFAEGMELFFNAMLRLHSVTGRGGVIIIDRRFILVSAKGAERRYGEFCEKSTSP
jgi:hypothetical protein